MSLGSWQYLLCNFSILKSQQCLCCRTQGPGGILPCTLGSIKTPIKANLALPTCSVKAYLHAEMCEIPGYVSNFLQLLQLF